MKECTNNKIDVTANLEYVLRKAETLWEKEKMQVTSIFSFSYKVFRKLLFQGHLKLGLWLRVNSGLPAYSVQADMGRNLLILVSFSHPRSVIHVHHDVDILLDKMDCRPMMVCYLV